MLRAYKTPIFAKGQKLTHSPAHEEKHAGQETPLHYTPYLQWHHPGGRALLQLMTLLWRRQENTALLSSCGLTGDATTRFPCWGLEGRGALFACTAWMLMESNCPRRSWRRCSQLFV